VSWKILDRVQIRTVILGDGDFSILGLKMDKKRKNFESGKCRTSIYGNFLMIAEK